MKAVTAAAVSRLAIFMAGDSNCLVGN